MSWIDRLRAKWHEVPLNISDRGSSRDLATLTDAELLATWNRTQQEALSTLAYRWIIEVYRDFARDKKIIEIGPGTGMVGLTFAEAGARVTFGDVVPSNLEAISRVSSLKGLQTHSLLIEQFTDPQRLDADFDAIFAIGSLHHAPAEVLKPEFEALASRLKIGGRFIALTYPKERWIADGSRSFAEFGKSTDGDNTPWPSGTISIR
jgi:cyclopropane fatty-acyl-phospholipid synthase-like methyltransferase